MVASSSRFSICFWRVRLMIMFILRSSRYAVATLDILLAIVADAESGSSFPRWEIHVYC